MISVSVNIVLLKYKFEIRTSICASSLDGAVDPAALLSVSASRSSSRSSSAFFHRRSLSEVSLASLLFSFSSSSILACCLRWISGAVSPPSGLSIGGDNGPCPAPCRKEEDLIFDCTDRDGCLALWPPAGGGEPASSIPLEASSSGDALLSSSVAFVLSTSGLSAGVASALSFDSSATASCFFDETPSFFPFCFFNCSTYSPPCISISHSQLLSTVRAH